MIMIEVRRVIFLREGTDPEGTSGVLEILYILIWVGGMIGIDIDTDDIGRDIDRDTDTDKDI